MVADISRYCEKIDAYDWHVPLEYLDKDSAREYVNFFIGCDGSYVFRFEKSDFVLKIKSICEEGLREFNETLVRFFDVEGRLKTETDPTAHDEHIHVLEISGIDNLRKLLDQGVWSYKSEHIKKLKKFEEWLSRREERKR